MNTANKITLVRVLFVPVFIFFVLAGFVPANRIIAAAVFILASLTDKLDGYIARKYNQITDFGKFLDPLADKLLVISALVAFVQLGLTDTVLVMIIIARELMVTSLRLAAASDGKVLAAGVSGKAKTVTQIIAVSVVLLEEPLFGTHIAGQILLWIACAVTVYSGAEYFVKNYKYINTAK